MLIVDLIDKAERRYAHERNIIHITEYKEGHCDEERIIKRPEHVPLLKIILIGNPPRLLEKVFHHDNVEHAVLHIDVLERLPQRVFIDRSENIVMMMDD